MATVVLLLLLLVAVSLPKSVFADDPPMSRIFVGLNRNSRSLNGRTSTRIFAGAAATAAVDTAPVIDSNDDEDMINNDSL